ncbi:MAG: 5-(carboxyamino)imidazole ribonucleotide mutase [Actinobacteria bacterium RBG_19FT_COMBO_54_7]|uniref:N5-carboxyaminoimidazole ribonucleotide mutase n=1 Tax=Candidatus Solincola sediminis TaxID=1797199 RepID=A0A1F2WK82_9ACTN|nr:MAG: 5-(carboxyamino)imidazole ribonucleotide mutase [Candidatus Solincola sediminis]OFW57256.1 MAG: 5-(carboxyamino)imidazole ribonucleotide mutase [Candidatus Solincola sediminis]OFW70307.1 MAG: 5-(carboxyamino)imidazole ribonucleotide mutase [Actinobacteria bacterium RBG_19FT_COMBO_54_7]
MSGIVALIMGSKSDLKKVVPAEEMLGRMGVKAVTAVISAHRQPEKLREFVESAGEQGVEVFIAAAGKAAHLPGVVASLTTRPVIGLPISSSDLGGLDALLSIVQMPGGIPVATVAIDGAENAALLACSILALKYDDVAEALKVYRKELAEA